MIYFIDTSDKRNSVLAGLLSKKGFKIATYKTTNEISSGDCIIFAPNKKFDDDFVKFLPDDITIFCGTVSEKMKIDFQKKKIKYVNFLSDEIFAIQNANLTAEGILALILTYSEVSITKNKILILGSGRVGKATARLFEKIGVNFALVSHNKTNFESNHLFNCKNYFGESFVEDLGDFDVIINTIPAKILDENSVKKISKNCLFLEISSIQTIDVENIDFTYMLCPALPQRFSAETAGEVLFDCFCRLRHP